MKIAYFINTFKSINWGGQATSSGIEYMLNHINFKLSANVTSESLQYYIF